MRRWTGLAWLLSLAAAGGVPAQEGGDMQARIVYAYQAEDSNQLASLVQGLRTRVEAGDADAALRYHLAHAQYRLGLMAQGKRAAGAEGAFAGCIEQLKAVLAHNHTSVEALALQSACYGELAKRRKFEAVLLRSKQEDRLNAAFRLDPRNPRVLFFMAEDGLARAKPGTAQSGRAFERLQEAAKIFDQSSATRDDAPGWGHAQAFLALGTQLRNRGDALGARNWIEKALIAAPDYRAAQRQMASLVNR